MTRENDALSAAFDVEVLALGGLKGEGPMPHSTSGECGGNTEPPRRCEWQRQLLVRRSKQLRGRTAPGAQGWVKARPVGPSARASVSWSPSVLMRPAALAHQQPLAQCVARLWNHWLTMLFCTAARRCLGDMTSSPKPGKPFAATPASLLTSSKSCRVPTQRVFADLRRGPHRALGRGGDKLGSQSRR